MKSALNLDLTRSNARSRREDFDCIFFIHVGAFCVELWPFYCKKRISVPMSYISFWEHYIYISKLPAAKVPLRAFGGWVTREDVRSVGVRSMCSKKVRFDGPTM